MGFSRRALVLGAVLFGFSCFFWVFLVRQDDGEGEQEWRGAPSKKRGAKQMSCYLPATFRVFLFFIFWGDTANVLVDIAAAAAAPPAALEATEDEEYAK